MLLSKLLRYKNSCCRYSIPANCENFVTTKLQSFVVTTYFIFSVKMSPLSSKERSQKYRHNVNCSPAKRKLSKNRRRLRHYQSKAKKLMQKLSNSFETHFNQAKMEGKLKAGWYFTVDNCIDFSFQQCIEVKNCLNSGRKWARLGDDGRYFTKNDDNSLIDKVTNKKFQLLGILRTVFEQRLNVSCMTFIKHSECLHEVQPFHVDDKDQYKKIRDMDSDDLHQCTFHDIIIVCIATLKT